MIIIYIFIPLNLHRFDDYSTMVLDNEDNILRVFLNEEEQWCLPPFQNEIIPKKLETAVLTYEDRSFYYHFGINPWAILRAFYLNIKYGKIKSGGSTITMQVARIASPKSRTIPHKILEMLQSLKLEIKLSKKQILQLYLNHAPYGSNIVGIRAASLKYFGKEPNNLTWSEAATLAVLPNAPGLIMPGYQQKKLIGKRDRLLDTLCERKIIDEITCSISKMEKVPNEIYRLPMLAPHLSQKAFNETNSSIIHTTLNKQIQENTENILNQQSGYLQSIGINNISVIIAKTGTGEIVSYCGSQNFWDKKNNGEVDGIQASRSPGSTLKPFLYALCMDDGILLPETKLNDVPTYFGAFSPENADRTYSGLVTAHEALVKSLNVPAVRLLYTYGLEEFYAFLKAANISTLFRQSNEYGLTLIIGGSEVNLFDLAGLYRGIGNNGKFGKLFWNKANQPEPEKQLISEGACYLTLNIMRDLKRPGAEYYWNRFENQSQIAWKTGTSFGNRDAWAMGVTPEWTIGVWVGNFTGEGNSALGGAVTAGPILFEIFKSLPKNHEKSWFSLPPQLSPVTICKNSGFIATKNCLDTSVVLAPENMKPLKLCPYHKKIFVNEEETFTVCSSCWKEGNYHSKVTLEYSPIVEKYLQKRGQVVSPRIPHNPQCDQVRHAKTIEIIYPTNQSVVYIPKDFGGIKQKLSIQIANRNQDSKIFWYLDGEYVRTNEEINSISLDISKGTHKIYVTDEFGNDAQVSFKVISK